MQLINKLLNTYDLPQSVSNINLKIEDEVSNALGLLNCFTIPGTKAAKLIEKMHKYCNKNNSSYTASNNEQEIDDHSKQFSSMIFEYASLGNIPVALSAISPYFLLNKEKYPADLIKEMVSFINHCAEDQSIVFIEKMEQAFIVTSKIRRLQLNIL